jgi:SGNH domain (fused to AT3 domains)
MGKECSRLNTNRLRSHTGPANPSQRGLLVTVRLIGASVVCTVLLATLAAMSGAGATTVDASAIEHDGGAGLANSSITHSIAVAIRLKSIPESLSPPLADVPNVSYKCLDSLTSSSPQQVCSLGDVNSTKTVVLFGDSHAWQWTDGLDKVAAQRGWKLVTYAKGACPVEDATAAASAIDDSSTKQEDSDCAHWRSVVFSDLSRLRPALVILSSQTKVFETAKDMTTTINKLKADGAKVAWIEDTPYPGLNIPDCLSRYSAEVQKCAFSLTKGLDEPKVRNALNKAAALDGAVLIDPAPWLCTTKICPPIIGNTVVYFDNSHISGTYAARLTPELSAALASSMPDTGASS